MSFPRDEPWTRLQQGLEQTPAQVHATTDAIRERVQSAFEQREVTANSLLVERRRRLAHAMDELDDAAAGGRFDEARELASKVEQLAPQVVAEAEALPPASPGRSWTLPGPFRNAGTVARKEVVLAVRGTRGLLLFGLLLVTFGIGLQSALGGAAATGGRSSVRLVWNYAHSLDFLAVPLAGILVGYGLINEELQADTIHVLAAQPVGRLGIVAGKWLGMAATLALAVAASSGLVGAAAYASTGALGRPAAVFVYPVACYLLALAFGSIALLASSVIDRTAPTLAAGFGAFVVLGPLWQNLFLTRSLASAGSLPSTSGVLVYLATPFTAWWNWTSELLGPINQATGLPQGEPWHAALVQAVERGSRDALPFYATHWFYAAVLVAWAIACVTAAVLLFQRRDLG